MYTLHIHENDKDTPCNSYIIHCQLPNNGETNIAAYIHSAKTDDGNECGVADYETSAFHFRITINIFLSFYFLFIHFYFQFLQFYMVARGWHE